MNDALKAANEAMAKHARACSVSLCVKVPGEFHIGAATCIKLGDHFLLATAGHLLSRIRQQSDLLISPWGTQLDSDRIRFEQINYSDHLGDLDVGWIEIDADTVRDRELSHVDSRCLAPFESPQTSSPYLVYGSPRELLTAERHGKTLDLTVMNLGMLTASVSQPDRPEDIVLHWDGKATLEQPEREIEAPPPGGMSGGGVWAVTNYDAVPPWSPTKCKFVGIIRGYDKTAGNLRATQLQHWLRLVRDDFDDMAAEIDAILDRHAARASTPLPSPPL